MIGRLWLLARGQVRVQVTGASLPRFLNLCARHGVILRRMKRTAWNELYATLSVADFRRLRQYMGRTGCRVHIVRRQGAPFWMERLRPRVMLWGGLLLLIALHGMLYTRLWAIETRIDPRLPAAEIMCQLDTLGVRIGAPLRAIDVPAIRWRMLQWQPDITFFALNIRGNSLTVEIAGRKTPEELLDQETVVKVVASRSGVVHTVRALDGQPVVQPGDAVSVGDTLISGLVPPTREGGGYHLTHARGRVEAYTTHTVQAARPLQTVKKRYTGKVRRQYALVMGNKRLNLYIGSGIAGGTCDKIIETRTLRLSDSVVVPISLVVQSFAFYECETEVQTVDAVRGQMLSRALGAVTAEIDGTVTDHTETLCEENGAAVLRMTVHTVEQIGEEALDDSTVPEETAEGLP